MDKSWFSGRLSCLLQAQNPTLDVRTGCCLPLSLSFCLNNPNHPQGKPGILSPYPKCKDKTHYFGESFSPLRWLRDLQAEMSGSDLKSWKGKVEAIDTQ